MTTAEKILLILRMQAAGGGGSPWDDAITALSPVYWYKLAESGNPVANSGSAGGTGTIAGGSQTFQAGSLNDPLAGVAMQTGAILSMGGSGSLGTDPTVMMLVKTNATLEASDCYLSFGSSLQLLYLADGRVRIYDDIDGFGVSSAAGVVKANEWNLIFWQPSQTTGISAYATSETANGTVSQVITSGLSVVASVTGNGTARPSNNNLATLGAFAIFDSALTTTQMQDIASTLPW
jgi:hypothetical protein